MKITSIKQQVKRVGRYSVFVDEQYAFSLSEAALLESGIIKGQELTEQQVKDYKKLADEDKIYAIALRYAALRIRTRGEMAVYLQRKKVSPPLAEQILNKLSKLDIINDEKFAQAFVHDRRLFRPTSRRKLSLELRKKYVSDDIIQQVIGHDAEDEQTALQTVIERKRRQTKYQDDLKLMQYLARQGFSYTDIKAALSDAD